MPNMESKYGQYSDFSEIRTFVEKKHEKRALKRGRMPAYVSTMRLISSQSVSQASKFDVRVLFLNLNPNKEST